MKPINIYAAFFIPALFVMSRRDAPEIGTPRPQNHENGCAKQTSRVRRIGILHAW